LLEVGMWITQPLWVSNICELASGYSWSDGLTDLPTNK
jgi:hypothetical protein